MATVSPYMTALKLGRPKPNHVVDEFDKDRVTAYWTYQDIYRNVEEVWTLVLRDFEGNEISRRDIPSARTIIEATNRYLAKGVTITPLPLSVAPDGSEIQPDTEGIAAVMRLWNSFAKREEFFTKFNSLKRWMLIRGDAIFHLMGDDSKLEGSRLRLLEEDPATYFPKEDPTDATRITGVYLVNIVPDDSGEPIAQRQEYVKTETGAIWTQLRFFESDKWDDRFPLTEEDLSPVAPPTRFADAALITGFELPAPIDTIPVYHYRNNRDGNEPFGISELQGIETLLAGIIQTATDEDVTVALTGIGVYATDAGKPTDEDGNEVEWVIAPASVIEMTTGGKFERVQGVDTVQPFLDHINMLKSAAQEVSGTPDIAVGRVDVQVAESGIALAIQMAPTLSKNVEKEQELKGKSEQMLYDFINKWLPAYEKTKPANVEFQMTFDDPLPENREVTLNEIVSMVTAKLIPVTYAQQLVRERLGYDIPEDALQQIVTEQQQMLDATGVRLEEEAV